MSVATVPTREHEDLRIGVGFVDHAVHTVFHKDLLGRRIALSHH